MMYAAPPDRSKKSRPEGRLSLDREEVKMNRRGGERRSETVRVRFKLDARGTISVYLK